MATTNELVHTNLVNLTGRLAGGVPEDGVQDDLEGLSAMAGNEGEAAAADMIQTLSFTTWIKDICDGYKQEKELEKGTTEYNENAATIRECIQNINNLGRQLGMQGDTIPTPQNGKEAATAASAVYMNFALPYEAGAQVDYAKYMQMQDGPRMRMGGMQQQSQQASQSQEIGQQMQRAMRRLNAAVAQSPQYGVQAKNYWNAVQASATKYNAKCGEFLDSMDSLEDYERQFDEAKAFLSKEESMSSAGMSDFQMGGATADKIDFEGDDLKLQSHMRETIAKAEKLIKTERAMLRGGHIDTQRRALFEQTLKGYIKEMQGERADIEADNAGDVKATAELEQQMKERPQDVTAEHAQMYYEMVEKQQTMAPNLHMSEIEKAAKVVSLGFGAMNTALIATGVTPIGINAASAVSLLRVGKFAYDMNRFMQQEHAPESKVKEASLDKGIDLDRVPEYKGSKKPEEPEVAVEEPMNKGFLVAVKRKATDFSDRLRTIIREHMVQFDEQSPEYDANEQFKETIEHFVGTIVDENGCIVAESVPAQNQSKNLVGLDAAMVMGTGEHAFDKDPQEMTEDELKVYASAVTAVMAPMKDEDGKYLPNFSDCYAVGEEVMPEPQQEYTDATTSLMIIGQPAAALEVRQAQTELIDCSTQYAQLSDDTDLTHVEDDTSKYEQIQERADKADERARQIMDVYKPLVTKAGVAMAASAYKKHEYNKAWKEACRERNLQLMCQGTIQSMEKSAQENHMLNHERLYGAHGLLRA